MTEAGLFDPAFLSALEALRLTVRSVPAGGRPAEHRSRTRGAGLEFADMRPYVPGDDLRSVDWHLFQRLDKVFVRLYLHEEDLPVHFLLDESASMTLTRSADGRSKHVVARQALAALAYIAMNRMDRVTVWPFAGEPLEPLVEQTGGLGFERLLRWLSTRPTTGRGDLVSAARRLAERSRRRGVCVIVSDCFDVRGIDAVREALAAITHRICLVRPVHAGESEPTVRGPLELVDCEGGESLTLEVDDSVVARYRSAYESFVAEVESAVAHRGGGCCTLTTAEPVVPQIAALFERGAFVP